MTWEEFEDQFPEYTQETCQDMDTWMRELWTRVVAGHRTASFDDPKRRLIGFFDLIEATAFYVPLLSVKESVGGGLLSGRDMPILKEMGLEREALRGVIQNHAGRVLLCGPRFEYTGQQVAS